MTIKPIQRKHISKKKNREGTMASEAHTILKLIDRTFGDEHESKAVFLALAGEAGHADIAPCSDEAALERLRAEYCMHAKQAAVTGAKLFVVRMVDEAGVTDIGAPIIRSSFLNGNASKMLTLLGLHGVPLRITRMLRQSAEAETHYSVLTFIFGVFSGRGTLNRNPKNYGEAKRLFRNDLAVAPVVIREIGADEIENEVRSHLIPSQAGFRLRELKKKPGTYRLTRDETALPDEVSLRNLEVLSQIDLCDTMVRNGRGEGSGAAIAGRMTKVLNAFQQGRVNDGVIIPSDLDVWKMWADVSNETRLPIRFDHGSRISRPKKRMATKPKLKAKAAKRRRRPADVSAHAVE